MTDLGKPVEGIPGAPGLYLPDVPFPPYRFVPGKTPHPLAHAEGYRHGESPAPTACPEPGRWKVSDDYLRGCDFFNRGWWWEAHEVWEAMWHTAQVEQPAMVPLLQGLIQLAACALNRERGVDGGADRLLASSLDYLEQAERHGSADGRLAGLHLPSLRLAAKRKLGKPRARIEGLYITPGGQGVVR